MPCWLPSCTCLGVGEAGQGRGRGHVLHQTSGWPGKYSSDSARPANTGQAIISAIPPRKWQARLAARNARVLRCGRTGASAMLGMAAALPPGRSGRR